VKLALSSLKTFSESGFTHRWSALHRHGKISPPIPIVYYIIKSSRPEFVSLHFYASKANSPQVGEMAIGTEDVPSAANVSKSRDTPLYLGVT
jgi:hypothetical protein